MKGINLQFDNLVLMIQKNTSDKDLLKSRENFDIVYQKITQQALKTVALMFDNLIDDHSIKKSFNKLLKELKSYIALKPAAQEEEDDYFNHEFDEVQHFMNNRKPVIAEVDNSQRGDIVKFLFQAENKEKDIEEFMGNMNKFNDRGQGTKKFRTLKQIAVVTNNAEIQTNLTMGYFQKLEAKMPALFRMEESSEKSNCKQSNGPLSKQSSNETLMLDIDAQIDQLIRQKMQQATNLAKIQEQEQKEKQKQKTKIQKQLQQAKKKKPQQNQKRKSQVNGTKRSSNILPSSLKTKPGINKETNNKALVAIVEEKQEKKEQNTTASNSAQRLEGNSLKTGNDETLTKQQTVGQRSKIQNAIPSFDLIFSTLSGVKGIENISQEQMKIIYESIKSSTAQTLLKSELFAKPSTLEQECNTIVTYSKDVNTDDIGNLMVGSYQNENSVKRKKGKNGKKAKASICRGDNMDESNRMSIEEEELDEGTGTETRYRVHSKGVKFQGELNRSSPNQLLTQQQGIRNHGFSTAQYQNRSSKDGSPTKSGLPNISRHMDSEITNKLQKSDSANILLKQSKSAEEFLKRMKDTKYLKPINPSKSLNKENYTLDMYKSKLQGKNRASDHTNLPSLSRNTSNTKVGISLHQNILDPSKSPYVKKTSKKNINLAGTDSLFPSFMNQNQGFSKKSTAKADKSKQISKQEQQIMKQLQMIVKQGAINSHMKHIAMYIQFVESVHVRKCGEKCIHLERFYDFLRRTNLSNRKELVLHRTDMNVNSVI